MDQARYTALAPAINNQANGKSSYMQTHHCEGVPHFAVEVRSPTQTNMAQRDKMAQWIGWGVEVIIGMIATTKLLVRWRSWSIILKFSQELTFTPV
jgi:hypothetical protein